uniref:Uncharacterized protein n=1 Tax=Mycena chlorophos TaxID=658473 RepID=A0ABQ0LDQ4_MYCCL|nr:predicted protein [Mycena chlorophos]
MGMLVFKTQILTQMVQVVKNENQLRFSSSCGTDCSVRTHWAFRVGVFTGPGTGPAGSFCSNIPSQRQSSESLVVIQRSGGENAGTTLLAKVSGLLRRKTWAWRKLPERASWLLSDRVMYPVRVVVDGV